MRLCCCARRPRVVPRFPSMPYLSAYVCRRTTRTYTSRQVTSVHGPLRVVANLFRHCAHRPCATRTCTAPATFKFRALSNYISEMMVIIIIAVQPRLSRSRAYAGTSRTRPSAASCDQHTTRHVGASWGSHITHMSLSAILQLALHGACWGRWPGRLRSTEGLRCRLARVRIVVAVKALLQLHARP